MMAEQIEMLPVTQPNTGNFIGFRVLRRLKAAKKGVSSSTYRSIPYASEQGNFLLPNRN
jgi:hypothetical protein